MSILQSDITSEQPVFAIYYDYLRLKITNPARNNASISPQGEWIP